MRFATTVQWHSPFDWSANARQICHRFDTIGDVIGDIESPNDSVVKQSLHIIIILIIIVIVRIKERKRKRKTRSSGRIKSIKVAGRCERAIAAFATAPWPVLHP